jgi:hypothetical protein
MDPRKRFGIAAIAATFLLGSGITVAQSQGPIRPPKTKQETPVEQPKESAQAAKANDSSAKPIDTTPPPIPVEEIIKKFAAKEAEFREARGNYTYSQSILVQDWDASGIPGGRYERRSEVTFSPTGKRYEKSTYEPPSTLKNLGMTPEDMKDIEQVQPFVLTTDELPKYIVEYQGRQQVDELGAYVFAVRPRVMEKGQRYFEGTIWVEDHDFQIVKTYGKAVPDLHSESGENLFPKFETFREQIDGKFWFPTYTRADDTLKFKTGPVRIRMVVRYSNYKQFKSTSRIVSSTAVDEKQTTPPPTKPPQR